MNENPLSRHGSYIFFFQKVAFNQLIRVVKDCYNLPDLYISDSERDLLSIKENLPRASTSPQNGST